MDRVTNTAWRNPGILWASVSTFLFPAVSTASKKRNRPADIFRGVLFVQVSGSKREGVGILEVLEVFRLPLPEQLKFQFSDKRFYFLAGVGNGNLATYLQISPLDMNADVIWHFHHHLFSETK
jgi:hypothetical protein